MLDWVGERSPGRLALHRHAAARIGSNGNFDFSKGG
jgi:hypothetical protein